MKFKYLLITVLTVGLFASCSEEDLDPTLAQSKSIETSINTTNDLEAVLNGAYDRMSASAYYGRDVVVLGDIFSDNVYSNANSNRFVVEGQMDLNSESGIVETLWAQMYGVIASANIVINAENIEGDQEVLDHLKGQAYALRALAHFDLVTFYGQQNVQGGSESSVGVPYVMTFRDNENLFPARNTAGEVKQFAYDDLDMASSLMSESLNDNAVFITTYAADALKARVAAYFGDWPTALTASKAVIDSGAFDVATEDEFLSTFALAGGVNTIFEIAFTAIDNPGINGLANIYQDTNYGDVVVLPNLAAIYGEDDVRGVQDVAEDGTVTDPGVIQVDAAGLFRNIGKYPSIAPYDDNVPVIRYEEIVLIYAEALLETGGADALTWLNMIPMNRGAELYTEATKDNILLERRKELAFEGFRFHDLARTGKDIPTPDPVQQTHGGPMYGDYNFALPVPFAEVDSNANIDQNFGY
ncbi:RagB/SusD family nutrient uptake outer membrane protein [Christiangramia sediminis]|uniref:RagB/SusD family nutrient uptake outer membrane protein n=1 Tax=Christiangramia sediminis TaxID=2881336 RepID=A0A9X1RXE7_9FLAO|nr:RagB/SusD family nutrient uptake outer membrane protein [Christiangramia sediminis]MCB7481476.1 RagB/SusD family nutrient uptake outer membrane protein [Christiangramia sediminis]